MLLDGVLCAAVPALRHRWEKRLERKERVFGFIRKEAGTQRFPEAEEIEFAGVVFTSKGFRPKARTWQALGRRSTARDLTSALGKVLWAIRVRGAGEDASQQGCGILYEPDFMKLYSRVASAAQGPDGYATELTLTAGEHQAYAAAAERNCSDRWTPYAKRLAREARGPHLLVTDATPTQLGYVVFNEDGSVRRVGSARREGTQVENEAWAVARGVRVVRCLEGGAPARRIIVGVDADTVRVVVNKGYARTEGLRAPLRAILTPGPVHAVRIPGVDNVADAPSRNKAIDEATRARSFRLLIGGAEVA